MEPAGLTVGVLALAGLFNNAVDCFEYVQVGRNFKKDFTTSILRLDNAQLRLSRWGQAVGFGGDLSNAQELNTTFGSRENADKVEERMKQIIELFVDAEVVSNKLESRSPSTTTALQRYNPQTDLAPDMLALHNKMRELSIERKNKTTLKQKMRWALYEEKHFRRLIEDVISLVDDLVELFPAQPAQKQLCEAEASQLNSDATRPVLEEIAKEQDHLLATTIERLYKAQVSSSSTGTR